MGNTLEYSVMDDGRCFLFMDKYFSKETNKP